MLSSQRFRCIAAWQEGADRFSQDDSFIPPSLLRCQAVWQPHMQTVMDLEQCYRWSVATRDGRWRASHPRYTLRQERTSLLDASFINVPSIQYRHGAFTVVL